MILVYRIDRQIRALFGLRTIIFSCFYIRQGRLLRYGSLPFREARVHRKRRRSDIDDKCNILKEVHGVRHRHGKGHGSKPRLDRGQLRRLPSSHSVRLQDPKTGHGQRPFVHLPVLAAHCELSQ